MTHQEVEDYLLSMPNSRLDYPFGEGVAVYKVFVPTGSSAAHLGAVRGSQEERVKRRGTTKSERLTPADAAMHQKPDSTAGSAGRQDEAVRGDWRMFALVAEKSEPVRLSLKCDPLLAETLRSKYETVMPGYHLNKKHWNTILLTDQLSWDEIRDLVRHSYDLVTG